MVESRRAGRDNEPKQSNEQDREEAQPRVKYRLTIKRVPGRTGGLDGVTAKRAPLRDVSNKSGARITGRTCAPKQDAGAALQQLKGGATKSSGLRPAPPPPPTWDDLPEELLRHIASFADCKGTARLCATNKNLYRCLSDAVHIAPKLHLPSSPFFFGDRLYVPVPPPSSLACMDLNAKHNGTTALQRAVQLKHWAMMDVLFKDARIDPSLMIDSPNARGLLITRSADKIFLPTPLHKACWQGHFDNALLEPLSQPGADLYLKTQSTPSLFVLAALNGSKAWLEALFGLKTARRHHWVEAMVWAVRGGNMDTVHLLLDLHGQSELVDEQKAEFEDLALFSAVEAGRRDIVHSLLVRVQRLKYCMACYTPEGFKYHLHAAAAQGFDDILSHLLDASGFHPDSYLNGGHRLLDSALFHGRLSTVKMLLDRGSKILQGQSCDSMRRPIRTADIAMTRLLLKYGADVNHSEILLAHQPNTYLHMALNYHGSRQKITPLVRLLLEHGADVDALSFRLDSGYISALHVAAMAKDPPLVRLLLAHGADAALTDQFGHTALHYAAAAAHVPCIKALLSGDKRQHNLLRLKEVQLAINLAKKGMVQANISFHHKSHALGAVQALKDYELDVKEHIKAAWDKPSPGSSIRTSLTRASSSSLQRCSSTNITETRRALRTPASAR